MEMIRVSGSAPAAVTAARSGVKDSTRWMTSMVW